MWPNSLKEMPNTNRSSVLDPSLQSSIFWFLNKGQTMPQRASISPLVQGVTEQTGNVEEMDHQSLKLQSWSVSSESSLKKFPHTICMLHLTRSSFSRIYGHSDWNQKGYYSPPIWIDGSGVNHNVSFACYQKGSGAKIVGLWQDITAGKFLDPRTWPTLTGVNRYMFGREALTSHGLPCANYPTTQKYLLNHWHMVGWILRCVARIERRLWISCLIRKIRRERFILL